MYNQSTGFSADLSSQPKHVISALDWALQILISKEKHPFYDIDFSIPQGMTNISVLIKFEYPSEGVRHHYLLRVPRPQSSATLSRKTEAATYEAIKHWKYGEKVVAFDDRQGWKLSVYDPDSYPVSQCPEDTQKEALKVLANLHSKKLHNPYQFEIRQFIAKYYALLVANLRGTEISRSEFVNVVFTPSIEVVDFLNRKLQLETNESELQKLHQTICKLLNWCESVPREMQLCHLDFHFDNLLVSRDGNLKLIDWEYSAEQDTDVDLAMFVLYSAEQLNHTDVTEIISRYFTMRKIPCPSWRKTKIYAYIAILGYMWTLWCGSSEVKPSRLLPYAQAQYNFAKIYTEKSLERLSKMENSRVRNAVIMAAGTSSRFVPFSLETPKGLSTFNGEVLIERQIRQLQESGINEIYVVTGYRAEEFDYLAADYGVTLVHNPHYATRNNIFSLLEVLDKLGNTYICSVDNFFSENPFEPYVDGSYYSVIHTDTPLNEWFVECDSNGVIKDVKIGNTAAGDALVGWFMCGHVYWDMETANQMRKLLAAAAEDTSMWNRLWEYVYIDHIDEISMKARHYSNKVLMEFDSVDDILAIDPEYLTKTTNPIIAKIVAWMETQGVSQVNRTQLHGFKPLFDEAEPNVPIGCKFVYAGSEYSFLLNE